MKTEMARVSNYPVCAIIPKPFDVEVFLNTVRSCFPPEHKPLGPILASGMMLLLADIIKRL